MPPAECNALRALYTATQGASWQMVTNWMSNEPCCNWHGVQCSTAKCLPGFCAASVVKLNLDAVHLRGSIPTALEALTMLEDLSISSVRNM
eukprot:6195777-Pleurochrysis_carterae.AAC.3